MNIKNVKAWACVSETGEVVALYETRESARNNKRYAASNGHKQVIVKLTFDSVVR